MSSGGLKSSVLLRAIVNLDPYTFAGDLAEDISAEGEHESDHRSAEEVLLSTLDNITDDKLTRFALRLALSGHRDIPREDEIDFLTEADAVFPSPNRRRQSAGRRRSRPWSRQQPRKFRRSP